MKKLFNLSELIMVIVVIAILAAIILPNISDMKQTASISALKADLKAIQLGVDKFRIEKGICPSDKQPELGNPQAINFNILYPKYLKKLPQEREAYYWVDQECKVFGSTIKAPEDVKVDKAKGSISWTPNHKSKEGYIFERVNERDIKLVEKDRSGNYDGKDGSDLLVSEEDKHDLDTPPVGENYDGYPSEGTMPDDNTSIPCETDGFICIYTAEELAGLGKDAKFPMDGKYRLANDIDLSGYDKWIPIGNKDPNFSSQFYEDSGKPLGNYFTGILDGNHYSIQNLHFDDQDAVDVGLFHGFDTGAKITNLTLTNSYIKAFSQVGTLASSAYDGVTIENVHMQGEIHTIDYEYATGEKFTVPTEYQAEAYVRMGSIGGLIGFATRNVEFKNVSADLKLTTAGSGFSTGGILGMGHDGIRIENAFVKGTADVNANFGGIVGEYGDFSDNYDMPTSIVNSKTDLTINAHSYLIENLGPYETQVQNEHIGGIVGYAFMTTIENSHSKVNITASDVAFYVGGLGGMVDYGSKINNSSSSGTINGGDVEIGGLVGYLSEAEVSHSNSSVNVNVPNGWDIGGLVGSVAYYQNHLPTVIKYSYATGNVTGLGTTGGLIGYHDGSSSTGYTSVENSYATGNVTGDRYIGGLIGNICPSRYKQQVTIVNTYASGEVTGRLRTGGLLGSFDGWPPTVLKNSFALNSQITISSTANYGGTYIGRVYGENLDSDLTTENNFGLNTLVTPNMDKTRTGKDGEDLTLEQAMSSATYKSAGWDFDSVWMIQEGSSYPTLK